MPHRIAILADVHLGTRQTQFPGQDLTYAPDLLRRAVAAIAAQHVQSVIIVGDLVNMGTGEEYALAREILSELPTPVVTIPGNHELVQGSLEDFRAKAIGAASGVLAPVENGPAFLLLNSGIEGLTAWHWHGRVDQAGLDLLDDAARTTAGRPWFVFCHHPPEGTVRLARHPMMTLLNSDDVMCRLLRHPSSVVMFCGHTHVPDVYIRRNLTVVGCPPLVFWPHAFLLAELEDHLLSISTHRLFASPADSPDSHLNERGYQNERESWVPRLTIRLASST